MVQISTKDIKINLERITALSKHRVETKRTNRPAGSNVTAVVFENVKTHSNKKKLMKDANTERTKTRLRDEGGKCDACQITKKHETIS